jgi:glycosyltransferase involved in cell wall biosynthesis
LDNVQVIHEGIELPEIKGADGVGSKSKKRFCLFVGVGRKNKNLEFLVDVHMILRAEHGYCGSLIIVGNIGSELERELKSRAFDPDSIEFAGYISTKEKQRLYSECDAFVFPTLYEGFGLPPLEAAIHGAPVVVSDIEVMREVCSDFGNFGCVKDPAKFASTLAEVIRNPDKGVVDPSLLTSKFDWQQAVNEYSRQIENISYRANRLFSNL